MRRSPLRTLLAVLATGSLATTASVLTAPTAHAAVDAATFHGAFRSTCTLPEGVEGPASGAYRCDHAAVSGGCVAVADSGPVVAYARLCKANLVSGRTVGHATPTPFWFGYWTCDNGSGTGTFAYQPSSSDPLTFTFPVQLTVVAGRVHVSGSYTQVGTGRHIRVRASFPAVCTYDTNLTAGYEGDVTPV